MKCSTLYLILFQLLLWSFLATAQQPRYEVLKITTANGLADAFCYTTFMDSKGYIWFGTERGLQRYDGRTFKTFKHIAEDSTSISNDFIKDIVEDQEGYLWIATEFGGLNRYDPVTETFLSYQHDSQDSTSLASNILTQLFFDQDNNLWIGINGGFALLLDQEKGIFKNFECPVPHLSLWGITEDINNPDFLWIGMRTGLFRFNRKTEQTIYFKMPETINGPGQHGFTGLYMSSEEAIWGGGFNNGLMKFNPRTQEWVSFLQPGLNPFFKYDHKRETWLPTYLKSPIRSIQGRKDINYPPIYATGIFPISETELLIAPYALEVLRIFDVQTATFRKIHLDSSFVKTDEPLTGREIYRDHYDRLWLPIFQSPWQEGVFYLDPTTPSTKTAPIHLTELKVNGRVKTWDKNINYLSQLELSPTENTFSLGFVYLNYSYPDSNLYEYKLEGYDKDWQQTTQNINVASYKQVPPGTYTFQVKAYNPVRNIRNDEGLSVKIVIQAPWYRTIWAYVVYILFLTLGIGLIFFIQRQRYRLRLENQEKRQLEKLSTFKSNFYTNITHEFRTPLTVIQGIAEERIQDAEAKELIQRNSQSLLDLVQQMLDLSKIEAGKLRLEPVQANVVLFLRFVVESFHSLAFLKAINLTFYTELDELWMDYDPQRLQQVLSNLITNALKFTPEYGKVLLTARKTAQNRLQITIRDNGKGIPATELEHIFERFYQVKNQEGGAGIGLALAKELVLLMNGSIKVESQVEQGTTFNVFLPITTFAPKEMVAESASSTIIPAVISVEDVKPLTAGQPQLLIVEDNADVRTYLSHILSGQYHLTFAKNGKIGWEKALETIPDIILSDVLMPELDGFELTKRLKTNEHTSHIPIILLTARADNASKLDGLEFGADAYLIKPFDKKELFIRLRKLLELRQKLQARYQSLQPLTQTASKAIQQEDAFLQKLREVIEANMSNENFRIPEVCKAMGIGRSQLHRKLKALTGRSTSHVINAIRLQRAKHLLETTNWTISSIAYEVGFQDHSYFSKLFQEEFGMLPSELKK